MPAKTAILVVDDEEMILEAAVKLLGMEGFAVHKANDAEKAWVLFRSVKPEIALIDLKLPGLSGLELLKNIKRDDPRTVVIMMTGYSTLDNAVAFLKNGAFDFLAKPFEFEELVSIIQRARRSIAIPAPARPLKVSADIACCYHLGSISWAKPDERGALLGVAEHFRELAGRITRVDFPSIRDELRQGGLMAQLAAEDGLKHTVWSALSGHVIEVNTRLADELETLNRDPTGEGWLVRIMPQNLENELMNLSAEGARGGA